MANNENRNGYLALNAGDSKDNKGNDIRRVFLAEGIVTNVGEYREAEAGKASVLYMSVLAGRDPRILLGKNAENDGKFVVNADRPFISLVVSGQNAARMKDIQKNAKVIYTGRPVVSEYKTKDGKDAKSVTIYVDEIYQAQNKYGEATGLRSWVPSMVNCFTTRAGEEKSQRLGMISCEVIRVGDLRTTQSGREVISATVKLAVPALVANAYINGTYSKEENYGEYMQASISIWGDRASKMGKILVPGTQLVVIASSSTAVGNDGRSYVNLSVRDLSVMRWVAPANGNAAPSDNAATAENDEPAGAPADNEIPSGANYAAIDDDEDMDLPF